MTALAESDKPKKSISMGIIPTHVPLNSQKSALTAPHSTLRDGGADDASHDLPPRPVPDLIEDKNDENFQDGATKRKEYKTEYKNRFRPFPDESVDEFLELRKRAGLYKFRGWGTELGSSNQKESNTQLWDQVSRRSSLAPLALITTTPRYSVKEDKEKKSAQKRQDRPRRPHTSTPMASKKAKASLRKSRSQSAGPVAGHGTRSSPQKSTLTEKEGVRAECKVPTESDPKLKQSYIRPTTLATTTTSRSKAQSNINQHRIPKKSADPGYSSEAIIPVKSPVEITQLSNQTTSPTKVSFEVPMFLVLDAPGPGEAQEEIPKESNAIKSMTKPQKLSKVSCALKKFLYKEK
jgi:hypothetical protein